MTVKIFIKRLSNPFLITILLIIFINSSTFSQSLEKIPTYKDYNQSFEVRVDDLISRMTLEEKTTMTEDDELTVEVNIKNQGMWMVLKLFNFISATIKQA